MIMMMGYIREWDTDNVRYLISALYGPKWGIWCPYEKVHIIRTISLITYMYRDEIYCLQNLLSRTQAGPGRTIRKEQEEISPNHIQRINLISVRVQTQSPLDIGGFSYSLVGWRDDPFKGLYGQF